MIEVQTKPSAVLIARMELALSELDNHRSGWFQAVRQDAVETFPRLSWWRQCRIGCRVPVVDMVIGPLRRNLRTVAERFVTDAASILARETGRSAPSLELAGRGVELEWLVDPAEADFVFRRGWMQSSVPARRQFEDELLIHLEATYRTIVRSQLYCLMEQVIEEMRKVESDLASEAKKSLSVQGENQT